MKVSALSTVTPDLLGVLKPSERKKKKEFIYPLSFLVVLLPLLSF